MKYSSFSALFSRDVLRRVHNALGLACAVVFTIVCATGALYMFRDEIARTVERDRYYSSCDGAKERLTVDELIARAEESVGARAETVVLPKDPRRAVRIIFHAMENARGSNRRILADVDPYDGQTLGLGADKEAKFFMGVRRWHTRLNLPKRIGRALVDVCCACAVVLLLSGLGLWVPRAASLVKSRLTIAWGAPWRRVLFDAHNAIGFYTLVPLLLLSATGLIFAFGEVHSDFAPRLALDGGSERAHTLETRDLDSVVRFCLDDSRCAGAKLTIPREPESQALIVEATKEGFFSFCAPVVYYWDSVEYSLVKKSSFADMTPHGKYRALVRELHMGNVFGLGSKVLFLLGCLGGLALAWSGVAIAVFKRAGRASRRSSSNAEKKGSAASSDV